jgi:hypothetical protein
VRSTIDNHIEDWPLLSPNLLTASKKAEELYHWNELCMVLCICIKTLNHGKESNKKINKQWLEDLQPRA